jgi:hypothetical protein
MTSARFVQCPRILILTINLILIPGNAWSSNSSDGEKVLLKQLDDLQRKVDKIDNELNYLLKQKDDCYKDIQKVRFDVDHNCASR